MDEKKIEQLRAKYPRPQAVQSGHGVIAYSLLRELLDALVPPAVEERCQGTPGAASWGRCEKLKGHTDPCTFDPPPRIRVPVLDQWQICDREQGLNVQGGELSSGGNRWWSMQRWNSANGQGEKWELVDSGIVGPDKDMSEFFAKKLLRRNAVPNMKSVAESLQDTVRGAMKSVRLADEIEGMGTGRVQVVTNPRGAFANEFLEALVHLEMALKRSNYEGEFDVEIPQSAFNELLVHAAASFLAPVPEECRLLLYRGNIRVRPKKEKL